MGRRGEDEAPGHLLARLGVEAAQRGDLPEAERLLERAVRVAPALAQAHNNLGNLRLMQGRPDEAVALYRRATGLDPGNAKAHFNLGAALTGRAISRKPPKATGAPSLWSRIMPRPTGGWGR